MSGLLIGVGLVGCGGAEKTPAPTNPAVGHRAGAGGLTNAGSSGRELGSAAGSASGAGSPALEMPDTVANRLSPSALITGVCDVLRLAPNPETCVGVDDLVACSAAKCNVDACVATCQDELACGFAAADHCKLVETCPRSAECLACMTELQVCTFVLAHCGELVTCSTPTQGGACQKLEACCRTQKQPQACLGLTRTLGMVRGDAECEAVIRDPKFRQVYANDPPCTFD